MGIANTTYDVFQGTEGDIQLEMMSTTAALRVHEGPDFLAVQLPYDGPFTMLALLPDDLQAFEPSLHPEFLDRIVSESVESTVELTFPKVEISDRVSLRGVAGSVGLATLFDGADYPAFEDGTRPHDAYQRTRIVFTEEGTTADAGNDGDDDGAGGGTLDPGIQSTQARFDRPFIFAIRDDSTGQFLFIGRVLHPN